MRKWITFLMTLLVGTSVSYVSANDALVNFEFGYRRDDVRWKVKSQGLIPYNTRKIHFEDIDIFQIGVNARSTLGCNFYVRGSADWGWILDGKYSDDHEVIHRRTRETTTGTPFVAQRDGYERRHRHFREVREIKNHNLLDGRYVFDFDVAFGYPFYFCDCTAYVAPVIGYAFNEQNLRVESDNGRIFTERRGEFYSTSGDCCDGKFVNRWHGLFAGIDFGYRACECWDFYGSLEYHWAHFKGRHRSEKGDHRFFDDFEIRGKHGHGWLAKVGAAYDFQGCGCWTVGVDLTWRHYSAHRHCRKGCDFSTTDSTESGYYSSSDYIASSSDDNGRHHKTRHNWHSFGINITLGHTF